MNTLKCEVIRDLLPLYIDNICSEESKRLVSEHLEYCNECKQLHTNMSMSVEQHLSDPELDSTKAFQAISSKWNRKKRIMLTAFAVIMLILALLGSCFVSYLKFDTANPFSAASGFIQISITDTEYVEIQQSPKVILAQPNDALFVEYMENRGFTEIEEERLGALRVFTNGEDKEAIMYSQNAYFSKWCWK